MIAHEQKALTTADLVRDQNASATDDRAQDFHPTDDSRPAQLFAREEGDDLRRRWTDVQTKFVDDPRGSVKSADELVAATIKRLAEMFADERNRLEKEWESSDQVSTEDLRQDFRRYRSFFDRLLSI